MEKNNGSVVAAGDDCISRFDPSGNPDPAFGTGGSSPLDVGLDDSSAPYHRPDGAYVVAILEVGTGYLVVTDTVLIRFSFDGSRDPSFGGDGRIDTTELTPGSFGIRDAAVAADGSIFLTGVAAASGVVFKLKPTGELDDAFGEGGIYVGPSGPGFDFDFQQLALLEDGKVLVSGGRQVYTVPLSATVMRLTADGDMDEDFGEDGQSTTTDLMGGRDCFMGCNVGLNQMTVAGDGGITLMGYVGIQGLKEWDSEPIWAKVSETGVPGAISEASFRDASYYPSVELPDGDFAVRGSAGGRVHPDGSGGFADGHAYTSIKPSPGGFGPSSISFNAVNGHLVSPGEIGGQTGEWCQNTPCSNQLGAIAKIDATTGEPVSGFGNDGVAVAGANECVYGTAPPGPENGSWSKCLIAPPRLSTRVTFSRGASRRPSMSADLQFKEAPPVPLFASQRISFRLADRLRSRGGWDRSDFRIKPSAYDKGTFLVSMKGRVLTIRYSPLVVAQDPYYEDEPAANHPMRVQVTSRRGSIRPIPKRLRKRKLNFGVYGSFAAGTEDTMPWWGSSSAKKTVRLRPVEAEK